MMHPFLMVGTLKMPKVLHMKAFQKLQLRPNDLEDLFKTTVNLDHHC